MVPTISEYAEFAFAGIEPDQTQCDKPVPEATSITMVSAVTQNQPLRVEIKGFKIGHCLRLKTALFGLVTAAPEGHVECPESEPAALSITSGRFLDDPRYASFELVAPRAPRQAA
jgi:hypothetical protein